MCGCNNNIFCNNCGCNRGCNCGCNCGCRNRCGCDRDRDRFVTLSGVISDMDGDPIEDVTVAYTINGVTNTVETNANGRYTIIVCRGSRVLIAPQVGIGVEVIPGQRMLRATEDRHHLNFSIVPI